MVVRRCCMLRLECAERCTYILFLCRESVWPLRLKFVGELAGSLIALDNLLKYYRSIFFPPTRRQIIRFLAYLRSGHGAAAWLEACRRLFSFEMRFCMTPEAASPMCFLPILWRDCIPRNSSITVAVRSPVARYNNCCRKTSRASFSTLDSLRSCRSPSLPYATSSFAVSLFLKRFYFDRLEARRTALFLRT